MKNNDTFKKYVAPIIVLVAICLVISGALALTYGVTKPIIDQRAKADADAARQLLLPDADAFTPYEGEMIKTDDGKVKVVEVYTADNGSGMVVTVETKSFGGALTEMIGIDSEGNLTGIVVTKHADTPGVGTKAQTKEHLAQYNGLGELTATTAKQDTTIQAVSGATVSSNAVHYGVYEALEQYKAMNGGAK